MLSTSGAAVGDVIIKKEPTDVAYEQHAAVPREPSPAQNWEAACWARSRCRSGQQMSPPELLVCEVCQAEFPNFEILLLHKLCHFNTRHVCYVCDCYFASTDSLVVHLATIHHNLSKASGYYKAEAERAFGCCICLQRFSSNNMLDKHISAHLANDENFFGCKVCATNYTSYSNLLTHLNSVEHKDMKVKIQSIFVCFDCRRVFATRDSYAMHMMLRAQTETCDSIRDLPTGHENDMKPTSEPVSDNTSDKSESKCDAEQLTRRLHTKRLLSSTRSNSASPPIYASVHTASLTGSVARMSQHLAMTSLTCIVCWAVLDSCDSLAMHMMDEHTSSKRRADRRDVTRPPNEPTTEQNVSNSRTFEHMLPDSTKRKMSTEDSEAGKRSKLSPEHPTRITSTDNQFSKNDICKICKVSFCEHTALKLLQTSHRHAMRKREADGKPRSDNPDEEHRESTEETEKSASGQSDTENDTPSSDKSTARDAPRESTPRATTSPAAPSPEQSNMPEDTSDAGSSTSSGRQAMLNLMRSHEELGEGDVVDYVLTHVHNLAMCKYCKIVFTDRTIYYLHMGLHNLNNPWQCNLCGKLCRDLHDFSSHVIHL